MNAKQPATISDIARTAGVSTATVSRMINRIGRISTETERRVRMSLTPPDSNQWEASASTFMPLLWIRTK